MIERHEVQDAFSLAFPNRKFQSMTKLSGAFDFVGYRLDFKDGEPVVFRGPRNHVSPYEGTLDFGPQLIGENRFYELVPHIPVPCALYIEPAESVLTFPFGSFTYMPGMRLSDLIPSVPGGEVHMWGQYFSNRLADLLSPDANEGLISWGQIEQAVGLASEIESDHPRLVHMDFRSDNMLAKLEEGALKITGILDDVNSLARHAAFVLALLNVGIGLGREYLEGYESQRGPVDRKSVPFLLYRLETAALLTWVYRDLFLYYYRRGRLHCLVSHHG